MRRLLVSGLLGGGAILLALAAAGAADADKTPATRPGEAPPSEPPVVEIWDGGIHMANMPPFLKMAVWADGAVSGRVGDRLTVWRVEPKRIEAMLTRIDQAGWFTPPLKHGLVFPDGPVLRVVVRRGGLATTLDYHGRDQWNKPEHTNQQAVAFVAMWNAVQAACGELADPAGQQRAADPAADAQRAHALGFPPHSVDADTVPATPEATLRAQVKQLLKPWQTVDERRLAAATVVLVGAGKTARGPHVHLDARHSAYAVVNTIQVERVLKGSVAAGQLVIFDRGWPLPYFVEGRRYLAILKPPAADAKALADPRGMSALGDGLDRQSWLAAVDLDQEEFEAKIPGVKPVRSGTWGGFGFTPAVWAAMRAAKDVDYARQAQLVAFLENVVLAPGSSILDVGAWLGPPDARFEPYAQITYMLNLPAYQAPRDGSIYCDLKVTLRPGGFLAGYEIVPLVQKRVGPDAWSTALVPPEEMKRLGLRHVRKTFAPPTRPAAGGEE